MACTAESGTSVSGRPSRSAVEPSRLEAVVAAASGGDVDAVESLLGYLRPIVIRYCRSRLGKIGWSFQSADDVAQEVCLAVFRALPGYRMLGTPFLSFVYGVAAHKVADARRAAHRDHSLPAAQPPELATDEDNPERVVLRRELVERTGSLLNILTPRQRDILTMRVVLGLTAQETADLLGTSPDAIRVAQHRALNRLRRAIAG